MKVSMLELWGGELAAGESLCCGPSLIRVDAHSTLVAHAGVMPGDVSQQFARQVHEAATRVETRVVYLLLTEVLGGRVDAIESTLAELRAARDHAALVAYLNGRCYGVGLAIGMMCDLVFAAPVAMLGHLECRTPDGAPAPEATERFAELLTARRPELCMTFDGLVNAAVSGELAEAYGMVNATKITFTELAAGKG